MRSYRYCRAGAEYTEKLASGNAMVFSIVCFRHAHIRAFFLIALKLRSRESKFSTPSGLF